MARCRGETWRVIPPAVRLLAALAVGCLVALGLAAVPQPAAACSCLGITTATALRQADVVFAGTVRARDEVDRPKPGRVDLRFEVNRVYKGDAFRDQVVASTLDGSSCGLQPQLGSSWVIFATEGIEGQGDRAVYRLRTSLCSGNLPVATPPALLGPGRPPLAGASDREERATAVDAALTRGLKVAGGLVLAAVALAGLGLALVWRAGRPR